MIRDRIPWSEAGIVCLHCGNSGESPGAWEVNGWEPFRLVEEKSRSSLFSPGRRNDGTVVFVIEGDSGTIEWEPARFSIECGSCFEEFALPDGFDVEDE